MAFIYPKPRKDLDAIDNYHDIDVPDYYKWMEDPDSDETKNFVEEQNKLSVPFIRSSIVQANFKERLTELYNYPKLSCPMKRGERYFYFLNSGLQNQSVLYMQESLKSEPSVLLDPNLLSKDGTISLRGYSFSEDGKYLAYGLSTSGSDWVTIKFKEVATSQDLPDCLEKVKFSCMSWTHDHKGLFYNCYLGIEGKSDGTETTTNVNQKLFYHHLGTEQSEDVLFAEFPDNPKWMSSAVVTDDGQYVLLVISKGCDPVNQLWYVNLQTLDSGISSAPSWIKLIDNFDAEYEYITNERSVFTFKTNLNSPRYKLVNIDISRPNKDNWKTLVEEDDKDVLEWAECVHQTKLVVSYLRDVKSALELRNLSDGELLHEFALDVGSIVGFSGKKNQNEVFFKFMSFLTPGVIYRYDCTSNARFATVYRTTDVKGFDASLFETEQVFYSSKDGTQIPMFIVHKKGINLNGNHPTLLYGYGGFNISITPNYSVSRIIFMQNLGGIAAIANIRGGGEYGETWHKSGMLANKQNCFDDFQAAAQYLIDHKYTCPKKLTINGGSNGGLLVGACINQRPDLFGCAVAQVGVMDMLRFHKYTIGHAWTTDFGCADDDEEQFNYLFKYSPLHNIKVPKESHVQYPSLLLLTGDHDDRVVPHHSLKFIAQLQDVVGSSSQQTNPLLIRVDTKSGHGAGKPTSKIIEEAADMYGFIAKSTGAEWVAH